MNDRAGRTCGRTGLRIVPSEGVAAFRIAMSSYGPLSPLPRESGEDVVGWGRWDVEGHRTIYAAGSRLGVYLEVLQYFKPSSGLEQSLSEAFPDDQATTGTVLEEISSEWDRQMGGFVVGKLPRSWRDERRIHELRLPSKGWLIDVEHGDTLRALNAKITDVLPAEAEDPLDAVDSLTRADLAGESRRTTTRIAAYLHGLVLEDGSLPHGVQYPSKFGSNYQCMALWLRRIDDGYPVGSEPTKLVGTSDIKCRDTDFQAATRQHGLTPF